MLQDITVSISFADAPNRWELVDLRQALRLVPDPQHRAAAGHAVLDGETVEVPTTGGRLMIVGPPERPLAPPKDSAASDDDEPSWIETQAFDRPAPDPRPAEAVPADRSDEGLLGQMLSTERIYSVPVRLRLPEVESYPLILRARSPDHARSIAENWMKARAHDRARNFPQVEFEPIMALQQLRLDMEDLSLESTGHLVDADPVECYPHEYLALRDHLRKELVDGRDHPG
jgi:hypothetical protein